MSRKAFTLIELLVVVAISALLSTLAITYSGIGRNQVALSVEVAKITQFILRAKELSIATYTGQGGTPSSFCGYGVVFDVAAQEYSIFSYNPHITGTCRDVSTSDVQSAGIAPIEEGQYVAGATQIHLSRGVVLDSQSDSLAVVLFYPPVPSVFLSRDGSTFLFPAVTSAIHLVTLDGQNSATILVSSEGQVSF